MRIALSFGQVLKNFTQSQKFFNLLGKSLNTGVWSQMRAFDFKSGLKVDYKHPIDNLEISLSKGESVINSQIERNMGISLQDQKVEHSILNINTMDRKQKKVRKHKLRQKRRIIRRKSEKKRRFLNF